MSTVSHDFVTVDMRGMKAALEARAQAERVSVSALVRRAIARELGLNVEAESHPGAGAERTASGLTTVKLSVRLTLAEAEQLAAGARSTGLSRGAYLAGLVAGVPAIAAGFKRSDYLAALIASSAELSTLSRNVHHLTTLLRQGDVPAALQYRELLDGIADQVRNHLTLAAGVLVGLRPRRSNSNPASH